MAPISLVIALFSPRGGKLVIMAFLGGFLTPIGNGALTVVNWSKRKCRVRLPKIVRAGPPTRKRASGLRCDSACVSYRRRRRATRPAARRERFLSLCAGARTCLAQTRSTCSA